MQLSVEGMTCAHCERTITRAIEALGGRARVDLAAGTVAIEGLADEAAVRDAIEAEGYTVTATGGPAAGTCCGGGCHG